MVSPIRQFFLATFYMVPFLTSIACKQETKPKQDTKADRDSLQNPDDRRLFSPDEVRLMLNSKDDIEIIYSLIDISILQKRRNVVDDLYDQLGFSYKTSIQRFKGDNISVNYTRDRFDWLRATNMFDTTGICFFKQIHIPLENKKINDEDLQSYTNFFDKLNEHIKIDASEMDCKGDFKPGEVLHIPISRFNKECTCKKNKTTYSSRLSISKQSEIEIRSVSITITITDENTI